MDIDNKNRNVPLPDKLSFQIIDWCVPTNQRDSYDVNLYGITKNGKSVMCKVTGFQPYFYVRAPLYLRKSDIKKYINTIKNQLEDGIFTYRKKYKSFDDDTEKIIESQGLNYNDRDKYTLEID